MRNWSSLGCAVRASFLWTSLADRTVKVLSLGLSILGSVRSTPAAATWCLTRYSRDGSSCPGELTGLSWPFGLALFVGGRGTFICA